MNEWKNEWMNENSTLIGSSSSSHLFMQACHNFSYYSFDMAVLVLKVLSGKIK